MEFSVFSDDHFMGEALKEAQKAYASAEVPIGAVVVCQGLIIGRAYNLTEQLNDVTAHAEILAISAAADYLGGKYLNDCTLYVTIEPCVMCAGALNWAQIGRVVYGANDPKKGYSVYHRHPFHPKTKINKGVRAEECAALMKDFFRQKRS